MQYDIVPTAEEHLAPLREVLDRVAREKRFLLFLEAPPLEQAIRFWKDHIGQGNVAFVALVRGAVVGWCDPRHSTRHVGVVGIGVLKDFRGKGIGPALLRAAIGKARAAGLARIELDVREDNKPALALNLISMALLFK